MKALSVIIFSLLATGLLSAGLVFEATEIVYEADLSEEKAEGVFRFVNEGDEPITIVSLKSSCGCTVPELDKDVYGPGESGEIKALFTFGSRVGKQQKRVTVVTDDGKREIHNLMFTTYIPEWASIQPQLLRWALNEELLPKEIRLEITDPGKIGLAEKTEEMEHFTVSNEKAGPAEFIFSVVPKSTEARLTERYTVTLSIGEEDSQHTRELIVYCLVR